MSLWKFTRRSPTCVACAHEFADGEVHYSRLAVHPDELLREDLCRACWASDRDAGRIAVSEDGEGAAEEGVASPAEGEGSTLLWWRARRRIVENKRMQVDMEGLERVFHLLDGREEEHLEELRFLLCLLLVRKRRLLLGRAVVKGDREYLAVRRPRRKEELNVRVFDFQPERMEELRDDLERLFEGDGLPDASSEASSGSEDEAPEALATDDGSDEPAEAAAEGAVEGDPQGGDGEQGADGEQDDDEEQGGDRDGVRVDGGVEASSGSGS